MAKKDETKAGGKGITVCAGSTIRDKDGRPRCLQDDVAVEAELLDGRMVITRPLEMAGEWFDAREARVR